MSSYRKDARWQLAYDMLADTPQAGELAALPYAVSEKILGAAQALLEHLNDPALDARLAERFGAPEVEPVFEYAIGYPSTYQMDGLGTRMTYTVPDTDLADVKLRLPGYTSWMPSAQVYQRPHITDADWTLV